MLPQVGELGQAGGHGHRVAAECARLVHRAAGGHLLQQRAAAAVGAHRHSAADDLAEGDQIGPHAEVRLGAAGGQAEAGDHLVEDKQGAVLVAQGPQSRQEAGGGADHAHVGGHRLHDHRRHLAGVLLQQGLHAGQIVELGGEGVPGRPHRHAGAAGVAPRQSGGAGVDQHTVGVAVVAALELDELVPAGGPPGQPEGGHDRLGAGIHHAHHLNVGHHADHPLGDVHLPAGGGAEGQAVLYRPLHRLPGHRVVVTQDHGAPGADVVDVPLPVLVVDIGPVGPRDEAGGHAHGPVGPHWGVDPAGEHPLGPLKELFRDIHQPMSPFCMAWASSLA